MTVPRRGREEKRKEHKSAIQENGVPGNVESTVRSRLRASRVNKPLFEVQGEQGKQRKSTGTTERKWKSEIVKEYKSARMEEGKRRVRGRMWEDEEEEMEADASKGRGRSVRKGVAAGDRARGRVVC